MAKSQQCSSDEQAVLTDGAEHWVLDLPTEESISLIDLTEIEKLEAVYTRVIAPRRGRGIDRISVDAFEKQRLSQLAIIQSKVRDGSYRFSPYLERLILKGRGKYPRVISLPTLRDRIVLNQLKEYLHGHLHDWVGRSLPNEYVRVLKRFSSSRDLSNTVFLRTDIKSFYDRINHDQLKAILAARVIDTNCFELVVRAIRTPTVHSTSPRRVNRKLRNPVGVPQGLAISNILANAYLIDFDDVMRRSADLYIRYVDDILVLVDAARAKHCEHLLVTELQRRGLEISQDKTRIGSITKEFDYLGYSFQLPRIGVRKGSCERFIGSVAALFAEYRHRLRNKKLPPWMSVDLRQGAFLEELNERITGAMNETKRYGWLLYYSELNDESLLHRLDGVIAGLFKRMPDFGGKPPKSVKSLARTYFEARFSPDSGYIHNYNRYDSVTRKLEYLTRNGLVDPQSTDRLTVGEIEKMFVEHRSRRLSRLEQDVG